MSVVEMTLQCVKALKSCVRKRKLASNIQISIFIYVGARGGSVT